MTTLFDKVFYKCNEQKIAIIDEGQKINYKKFFEDCLRVYSFLKSYGRKKKFVFVYRTVITVFLFF